MFNDPKHQGAHQLEGRTSGKVCNKLCVNAGLSGKGKDGRGQDSWHASVRDAEVRVHTF